MAYFGPLEGLTRGQDDAEQHSEHLPTFLTDLEERRWRGEQLNRIKTFMESAVRRESELGELLDWLSFTRESFEQFERNRVESNEMVSSEWVEAMDSTLGQFMFDMNCGISRLNVLWQSICGMGTKKTRKEETALVKGGAWHWWREPKVDTKVVRYIQELQPPSVEDILEDASFGTKCSSELTFILEDIQKSMSGNRALGIAFSFIQIGLQNLNQAFQQRTKEACVEKERTHRDDTLNKMSQLSSQLYSERERRSQLEDRLTDLSEQKEALLFHIQSMMDYSQRDVPLPESTVAFQKSIKSQLVSKTEPASLAKSDLSSKPKKAPSQKRPNVTDVSEDDTLIDENTLGVVQKIERKSANLLQEFRETVFQLLENSLEFDQSKEVELKEINEKAKAQSIVKLYQFLKVSMHDCFNNIMSHIKGRCREEIIGMPLQDMSLLESELWNSSDAPPSEMLREISKDIKKHDKSIKDAGESLRALIDQHRKSSKGFEQKRRHTVSYLLGMLQNINDMEKQQACKMRLTLESLCMLHRQMHSQRKEVSNNIPPPPLQNTSERKPTKPKMVEEKLPEKPEVIPEIVTKLEGVKETKVVDEPDVIREQVQDPEPLDPLPKLAPEPLKQSPSMDADSAGPGDPVDRYVAEMPEEAQRLLRSGMMGYVYVINVESQRANVKLLDQALLRKTISPRLHELARDIIMQVEISIERRLCCIVQRYIKHARLQQVSKILNARLSKARNHDDGHTIRNCYFSLQKLERLQNGVLDSDYTKQSAVDLLRQNCIARMLYLFNQMRLDYGIHLATPLFGLPQKGLPHSALSVGPMKLQWGPSPSSGQRGHHPISLPPAQSSTFLSSVSSFFQLPERHHSTTERKTMSHQNIHESLWQMPQTPNSMWLTSKSPVMSPQRIPTLPRLIEMDVNQDRRRALRTLHNRMDGVLGQILKSKEHAQYGN